MTNTNVDQLSAAETPTRFVTVSGRRLAYRSIGDGTPLLLCVRFRGVLDDWDPAFLDALARKFRVITFDYTGLGQSVGEREPSYIPRRLAEDVIDLADALGLQKFALGGWSLGGQAAQAAAALHPERITQLVLIGTVPPGKVARSPEPLFYERALKLDNDLDDETVLFFEPASERSRAAARASRERIAQRKTDRSPRIPEATYLQLLRDNAAASAGKAEVFHDDGGYRALLQAGPMPILVISGDHEIVFPVQNWCDVIDEWQSLHLIVVPQAGHGPHHQDPVFCADIISSFIANHSA